VLKEENIKVPKIAISLGDLNGIGIEIALKAHEQICKIANPIYCINEKMLYQAAKLLELDVPKNFTLHQTRGHFKINPKKCSKQSGLYSYHSFNDAITLAKKNEVQALATLPINKEAWAKAGIKFKGHTEVLRNYFKKDALMVLGCDKMFVGLFTEHIPLKEVPNKIKTKKLLSFFLDFAKCLNADKIAVLALNPHAGDNGVLGDEEEKINKAIKKANESLKKEVFYGAFVPDIAFSPKNRQEFKYFIAMYHDQGLIALKSLYFDESINMTLNLPIIRTSVDHGTAFDIAYNTKIEKSKLSYVNAVKEALKLIKLKV